LTEASPGTAAFDKDLARARFEASQASVADLAQARAEAARAEVKAHWQQFLAGQGILDKILAAFEHLARAEVARSETPASRLSALATVWRFHWETDQLLQASHLVGRVSAADSLLGRRARLEAEVRLAQAGVGLAQPAILDGKFPDGLLEVRDLARARFEVSQARVGDVVRAWVEAAREEVNERRHESLYGRSTIYRPLDVEPLARAEFALSDTPASRLAALATVWRFYWEEDQKIQASYEAGRIRAADSFRARRALLETEVRLAQAGARLEQPAVLGGELDGLLEVKDLARARFEVSQARVADLARARAEAAGGEVKALWQEVLAGRGLLVTLPESLRHLLEAERALRDSLPHRRDGLENFWESNWRLERLTRVQYRAGRIGEGDYWSSRFRSLDAAIRLARDRENQRGVR
jgi:hypothetical protein